MIQNVAAPSKGALDSIFGESTSNEEPPSLSNELENCTSLLSCATYERLVGWLKTVDTVQVPAEIPHFMKLPLRLHSVLFLSTTSRRASHLLLLPPNHTRTRAMSTTTPLTDSDETKSWKANDPEQALEAKTKLNVWPLDEHNAALLNEVHPRDYEKSAEPHVRIFAALFKCICFVFDGTL